MDENKREVIQVPIQDILPNRFQPRLTFDDKELQELANSISRYGVIQPIVLRKLGDKYEIVAGERRYKASTIAGLSNVPAILVDTDDNTSAEIALLENLQRKNLTVIEEAQSFKKLIDRGFTQDEIATKLGISQSSIANKIRLLSLPMEVQDALLLNKISERHARCMLTVSDPEVQKQLLNKIINERLTVRQTEEEISFMNKKKDVMNEDIPLDIQRFLNPEPKQEIVETVDQPIIQNNNVEILDFKPEVMDINITEKIDNNEIVNPFQDNHKELIDRLDNTRTEIANEYNNIVQEDIHINESIDDGINPYVINDNVILDEPINVESMNNLIIEETNEEYINDKDIDLPRTINKVRDFIRSLDNDSDKISIDEVDMADSYQIIINIKKNGIM